MTSLPSTSRIAAGAIETSVSRWSFVSRNATAPSSPTRGTWAVSMRQRQVRSALPLADRQKLLQCWPVDEDALGALGDRAGDAVLEAVPVAQALRPASRASPSRCCCGSGSSSPEWRARRRPRDAGPAEPRNPSAPRALLRNAGGPSERPGAPSSMTAMKIAATNIASAARRTGDALRRTVTRSASAERSPGRSSGKFVMGLGPRDAYTRAIPGRRDRPAKGRGGLDSVRERTELPELPSFE